MTIQEIRKETEKLDPADPSFFDDIVICLSGIGDLIDVRFKIDEKMRLPGPFYLQEEKTGKIFRTASLPKVGVLASKKSKKGTTGFGIFLNMEDIVQPGSLMTFVLGGYRKEHVIVR